MEFLQYWRESRKEKQSEAEIEAMREDMRESRKTDRTEARVKMAKGLIADGLCSDLDEACNFIARMEAENLTTTSNEDPAFANPKKK